MYWRIGSFQELEHLSEGERKEILRKHVGWWGTAKIIAESILQGLVLGVIFRFVLMILGLRQQYAEMIAGLAAVAGFIVSYQYFITRIRGRLLMYLEKRAKEQQLPMCLHCGYNLEGLMGDICPECGNKIRREAGDCSL